MTDPHRSDLDFFVDLVNGYRSARVVLVANDLGVFPLLEERRTARTVADALATDERATSVLLRALGGVGLVTHAEGGFVNAPLASTYLVPGKPRYVGSNLKFQELMWPGWSNLKETVRTGEPRSGLVELLTSGPASFPREYLKGVEKVSEAPAANIAEQLDASGITRMLDVGSGLGTYARAFAKRNPKLRVTLLDLPVTIALARESLAADESLSRFEFREGDYLADGYGEGFDLVLLSHVTHDESAERIVTMLKKAHAALKPGGRVAIHDFVTQADGCGPLFPALFAVHMLVYTKGGDVYSAEAYQRLLGEAGFEKFKVSTVLEDRVKNFTTLITGTKPG